MQTETYVNVQYCVYCIFIILCVGSVIWVSCYNREYNGNQKDDAHEKSPSAFLYSFIYSELQFMFFLQNESKQAGNIAIKMQQ